MFGILFLRISLSAFAWLVLLGISGCPCFFRAFIHAPSIFLGMEFLLSWTVLPRHLQTHQAMKASTEGMFLNYFLTFLFAICCSFTCSQWYPRILLIAQWWNERSCFWLHSVRFQYLAPHSSVLSGVVRCTQYLMHYQHLCNWKRVWVSLVEMMLLLILASILVSSVRSGIRKAPRYLKEDVKWILFLLLFSIVSGISDLVHFFTWVRVEGKNIASVLDIWFGDPMCIWSPKWLRW